MKNNVIVLSNEPKGRFNEGIISGTPKPGYAVQIKAAVEPVNGRHTWELAAPGTDGLNYMCAIVREDENQGYGVDQAYVTGKRFFYYVPTPGEELNVRVGEVAGTGNTLAIGDKLMFNATGGYFIPHSGTGVAQFVVMETVTQAAAGSLVHVMKL